MAETLTSLYQTAYIDANDVEYVLAPLRQAKFTSSTTVNSHILGELAIWILSFDCCRDMPREECGIDQAVKAFHKNDPFYLRPGVTSSMSSHFGKSLENDPLKNRGYIRT